MKFVRLLALFMFLVASAAYAQDDDSFCPDRIDAADTLLREAAASFESGNTTAAESLLRTTERVLAPCVDACPTLATTIDQLANASTADEVRVIHASLACVDQPPLDLVTVEGLIALPAAPFLADPDVQQILADRYGLQVSADQADAFAMRQTDFSEHDFVWPDSPIVASMLAAEAEPIDTTYNLDRITEFIALGLEGTTWLDIGAGGLARRIQLITTEPTTNNVGLHFYGLILNALALESPTPPQDSPFLFEAIGYYRQTLGPLEASNTTLFELFLERGAVLIGSTESELLAWRYANPDQPLDEIVMLYPAPTMLITLEYISLTANGELLLQALQDPDLQNIGWERYGYRTWSGGNEPPLEQIPIFIQGGVQLFPNLELLQLLLDAL